MSTKITFIHHGASVRAGLDVTIQWEGYNTLFGRGHSMFRTDGRGSVSIDDDLIRNGGSTPNRIYIDNPDGGYSLYFTGVRLERDQEYWLPLESAQRQ